MTRAPAELRLVAGLAAKALAAAGAPTPGDGVAVAVSGGADSLALLHALRALAGRRGWRLAVLTVDHGLRPGSAADAAFVADHAKTLGLPARVLTLAPGDLEPHRGAGPEAAARAARYGALWPAADALGCPWLATGHTLDDQAETVLLQLLRGAGPDGLAGMAVRTGRLLRPLLGARRTETRAACVAMGLAWREDPTNAEATPLRNRVRTQLLPLLEDLRPGATRTLARTATLAATVSQGEDAPRPEPHGIALDAAALAALPVSLARRVVRAAARRAGVAPPDAGATDRVLALAGAADGGRTGWPGGSATREGAVVRLALPPD